MILLFIDFYYEFDRHSLQRTIINEQNIFLWWKL